MSAGTPGQSSLPVTPTSAGLGEQMKAHFSETIPLAPHIPAHAQARKRFMSASTAQPDGLTPTSHCLG